METKLNMRQIPTSLATELVKKGVSIFQLNEKTGKISNKKLNPEEVVSHNSNYFANVKDLVFIKS